MTFIFQDEADAEEDDEDEEDETEKKGRKKVSPASNTTAIRRLTRLTNIMIWLTQHIQIWNEASPIILNFSLFMKKKSKDAKSRRDSNASDKLEFTS